MFDRRQADTAVFSRMPGSFTDGRGPGKQCRQAHHLPPDISEALKRLEDAMETPGGRHWVSSVLANRVRRATSAAADDGLPPVIGPEGAVDIDWFLTARFVDGKAATPGRIIRISAPQAFLAFRFQASRQERRARSSARHPQDVVPGDIPDLALWAWDGQLRSHSIGRAGAVVSRIDITEIEGCWVLRLVTDNAHVHLIRRSPEDCHRTAVDLAEGYEREWVAFHSRMTKRRTRRWSEAVPGVRFTGSVNDGSPEVAICHRDGTRIGYVRSDFDSLVPNQHLLIASTRR